jgi:hypothetical protein
MCGRLIIALGLNDKAVNNQTMIRLDRIDSDVTIRSCLPKFALSTAEIFDPINTVILPQFADNVSTVDNIMNEKTKGYEIWRMDERDSSPKATITLTATPDSLNRS